jgi:hypothetical protein
LTRVTDLAPFEREGATYLEREQCMHRARPDA